MSNGSWTFYEAIKINQHQVLAREELSKLSHLISIHNSLLQEQLIQRVNLRFFRDGYRDGNDFF